MGYSTKIDWCDSSWNPVTGCMHGCEYCYARSIAKRFGGILPEENPYTVHITPCVEVIGNHHFNRYELDSMQARRQKDGKIVPAPYPFFFAPTFHKYRLDEVQTWKTPRNVFVGSMCDLFGDWVPDEWIMAVFKACLSDNRHRYLFLTKKPGRYLDLGRRGLLPEQDNFWYGTTITRAEMVFFHSAYHNCFLSIEPILEDFDYGTLDDDVKWVIIGAETGNRKGKVVPEKKWIDNIVQTCRHKWEMMDIKVPVFMKESLRTLMGDDFVQEFPWEVK